MILPSDISYDSLPTRMHEGARSYIERGREPGCFLRALFENDFYLVVCRADSYNMATLLKWATWLSMEAPPDSWGSKEKVLAWIKKGGLLGHEHWPEE